MALNKEGEVSNLIDRMNMDSATEAGIAEEDFREIMKGSIRRTYAPGEWLFHESSPRLWCGVLLEGQVEIIKGLHGSEVHLATLGPDAMIGEEALLDESAHSTSAYTIKGATTLETSREAWDDLRQKRPDIFYRIVARLARRISVRLHYATTMLLSDKGTGQLLTNVRRET